MRAGHDSIDTGAAASGRPDPFGRSDPPLMALTLWPNRSLSRRGFAWVMGIVAAAALAPMLPFVGTAVAMGLAPFLLIAPAGLWVALRRNYADGRLTEELRLWPDLITVERRDPRGPVRRWHADPYWVRLRLIAEDAPVEQYLTLAGNGREIELGAFLSPPEREALYRDLGAALGRVRSGEATA